MDKRELAFMGKITAGATHEMNNVLAVIKESTGLMEDILTLTDSGEFKHRDKFLRVVSGLSEQIARGVELSRRLNRFAHSMDEAVAVLDLNELLAQLYYLTARFARLRQVRFELAPPSGSFLVRTDPFRVLMVLVGLVEGGPWPVRAGQRRGHRRGTGGRPSGHPDRGAGGRAGQGFAGRAGGWRGGLERGHIGLGGDGGGFGWFGGPGAVSGGIVPKCSNWGHSFCFIVFQIMRRLGF